MAKKGQDAQGRDQDDVAFTAYTTVQKKILGSPRLQIAYVSAVSPEATYTAQQQITDLLRQRHKLGANEPDDFTVRNMSDIAQAANETNSTMTMLLACIAGVSLLVGGIGIMNIMLVSVTERRRAVVRRAQPIPDRIGCIEPDRRAVRHPAWDRCFAGDSQNARVADADLDDGDCRFSYLLSRCGNLLRLLSSSQSRRARSN